MLGWKHDIKMEYTEISLLKGSFKMLFILLENVITQEDNMKTQKHPFLEITTCLFISGADKARERPRATSWLLFLLNHSAPQVSFPLPFFWSPAMPTSGPFYLKYVTFLACAVLYVPQCWSSSCVLGITSLAGSLLLPLDSLKFKIMGGRSH